MVKRILTLFFWFFLILTIPAQAKDSVTPEIQLSLSKSTVWQREQVIVTLEVISDDGLSRLDSQPFEQDGFTVIEFEQSIKEHVVNQTSKTHIIKKWAIFPFLADQHILNLPRIRYRPSSGRPVVLKLPERKLKVYPLPIYIPPTMPVGKITLQNNWDNNRIISNKKLLEWNFNARSHQVAPQTLPTLSHLLRSSESVQILPPKQSVTMGKNEHGYITHKQAYNVPFKANSIGTLDLPSISIHYFNPETNRLEKATLEQPFTLVLNPWLIWILFLLLAALIIITIIKFTPKTLRFFKRRKQRNQALQSLKNASNYQQIKKALAQYSLTKDGKDNITLDAFVANIEFSNKNSAKQKHLESLISKLQSYQFKPNENQFKSHKKTQGVELNQIGTALFNLLR